MVKNSFGALDMLLIGIPVTKGFHLLWVVWNLFSWLKYLWGLSLGRSETPSNQTLEGIKFTRISSIWYFFDSDFDSQEYHTTDGTFIDLSKVRASFGVQDVSCVS